MTLGETIRELAKEQGELYSVVGVVTEIDKTARTCTVQPINEDATIYRVKLQSNENGNTGMVAFPVLNSQVIVTFLNEVTGYVALTLEIDEVEITIENQTIIFNKSGLNFSGQGENLFDLLKELIGILKNFQLSTNVGATIQVMPHITAQLELLETKFGKIIH